MTNPNDEQVPDQSPIPQTGTGDPGGLSTLPLSAEDLDPDGELQTDDDPDDDTTVS